MDIYAIATIAIMFLFVATFAVLAIAHLLEDEDDGPWVDPLPWRDDREMWEKD